jgi:hypothetical protein
MEWCLNHIQIRNDLAPYFAPRAALKKSIETSNVAMQRGEMRWQLVLGDDYAGKAEDVLRDM